MATKTEILDAAKALGELIAKNPVGAKLEDAISQLQNDIDAQRVMTDYQRYLQTIGEKEAQGQPIEVADKQKLQALQQAVVHNLILQQFQVAQMDYLDLMREVDGAIGQQAAPGPGPAQPASPLS